MTKREIFEKLNDMLEGLEKIEWATKEGPKCLEYIYNDISYAIVDLINKGEVDYKWAFEEVYHNGMSIIIYDRFCVKVLFEYDKVRFYNTNPFTREDNELDLDATDSLKKAIEAIKWFFVIKTDKTHFMSEEEIIQKVIVEAVDKYECVEDLQGSLFAVGSVGTIEEWREIALEWADLDENEGAHKTLNSLPESEVIDFIASWWDIVIKKVE